MVTPTAVQTFVTFEIAISETQTRAVALTALAIVTRTTPDWTEKRFSGVRGISK
jgi:hypothetical protein